MIYIITPCNRAENLGRMAVSIPRHCRWVISFDRNVKDPPSMYGDIRLRGPVTGAGGKMGYPMLNFALNTLVFAPTDWLYVLDDDNIIHPHWYDHVVAHCKPENRLITWAQAHKNGQLRLRAIARPRLYRIDTASYMWRAGYRPDQRFIERRGGDGRFAVQLGTPAIAINRVLAYYNYLDGKGTQEVLNNDQNHVITT